METLDRILDISVRSKSVQRVRNGTIYKRLGRINVSRLSRLFTKKGGRIMDDERKKIEQIAGQLSFFPAGKTSFLKSSEKEINFSFSFEDIIYKNPAFTVEDMERYHFLAEEMTDG